MLLVKTQTSTSIARHTAAVPALTLRNIVSTAGAAEAEVSSDRPLVSASGADLDGFRQLGLGSAVGRLATLNNGVNNGLNKIHRPLSFPRRRHDVVVRRVVIMPTVVCVVISPAAMRTSPMSFR